MTFPNPTQIRLGMVGNFSGRTWRVTGRAVLGEMEGGEIYYWNEFNVETDTGEWATLVFEQTERGAEWRWFTMFDPEFPITAQDAATKQVGDPVNLDGDDVLVTLVRQSRVYHVEGKVPEAVKVGVYADYFNAEAGPKMVVVSWTGSEVECYNGLTITSGLVASAFNLRGADLLKFKLAGGRSASSVNLRPALTFVVSAAVMLLLVWAFCRPAGRPPGAVRVEYNALPLSITFGGSGNLSGRHYRIIGHAWVEIAEVGLVRRRHEYSLRDDDGNDALLIYGLKPDAPDWFLFTPLTVASPLTPRQAGNVRLGQVVNIDGIAAPVSELFSCTICQAENGEPPGLKAGEVYYGFLAQADRRLLLARWNERGIVFQEGHPQLKQEIAAAFGQPGP